MKLSERRILSQVAILPHQCVINVKWTTQILRGDEVVAETYERRAYSSHERTQFESDVEGAERYAGGIRWSE